MTDRSILDQKRHNLETVDGHILSNIDMIIKEAEKAKSIVTEPLQKLTRL
jgi:hypothetical protein